MSAPAGGGDVSVGSVLEAVEKAKAIAARLSGGAAAPSGGGFGGGGFDGGGIELLCLEIARTGYLYSDEKPRPYAREHCLRKHDLCRRQPQAQVRLGRSWIESCCSTSTADRFGANVHALLAWPALIDGVLIAEVDTTGKLTERIPMPFRKYPNMDFNSMLHLPAYAC